MSGNNHDDSGRGQLPTPEIIESSIPAVIQVVALKRGMMGGASTAWTGSGTIVDPRGIILTNCHVANPRAMGMHSASADALGIAITEHSDEAPALTYLADIIVQSPDLDLAVLKIVATTDGKQVRGLNLPYIEVGDSDHLELADRLAIFGFPGIGGETVTFTSGSVSGFSKEAKVKVKRGWIKTDATIAGGNSGGTAIDYHGHLVGIPTQAAAGTNITPVDARPVVDTNRDGRVDQRDTPMAIGGFINGLRPINLAKPLLKKAGVKVTGAGSRTKVPTTPAPARSTKSTRGLGVKRRSGATSGSGRKPRSRSRSASKETTQAKTTRATASGPAFSDIIFSQKMSRSGQPINPSSVLPSRSKGVFATFDYQGMRKGTKWEAVWLKEGAVIFKDGGKWADASKGRKTISLTNSKYIPDGEYKLVITVRGQVIEEGGIIVGKRVVDTDSEIRGQVVDSATGKGISGALVIALKPGVRVMDFVKHQNKSMAQTSDKTDRSGNFVFPEQLPKGQAYGLVVVARGYKDLAVESAIRLAANTPERAQMNAIPMERE